MPLLLLCSADDRYFVSEDRLSLHDKHCAKLEETSRNNLRVWKNQRFLQGGNVYPSLTSSVCRLFRRKNVINTAIDRYEGAAIDFSAKATAVIASLVLIGAAVLNISTKFTDAFYFGLPVTTSGWLTFFGTWLLGFYEIVLGVALVYCAASRLLWLLATFTFAAFFFVSLIAGLAGRQSCDCFGSVIVWPYYTAALDLVLAGACAINFLYSSRGERLGLNRRALSSSIGMASLFVICFVGALYISDSSAIGRSIGIPPIAATIKLNSPSDGDVRSGEILLASRGSSSAILVGTEKSCTLEFKESFPITIEHSQVASLAIRLRRVGSRPIGIVPAVFLLSEEGTLRRVVFNLPTH